MKKRTRYFAYGFAALLLINLAVTGYLVLTVSSLSNDVADIKETQTKLTKIATQTDSNGSASASTTEYATRTGYFASHDELADTGVLIKYTYQPTPSDQVYVSASGLRTAVDTQQSFVDAKHAVDDSEYSPSITGMTVTVHNKKDWTDLHGRSGGLSIARMYASTDPDYVVNESVVLTGAVNADGRVESVNYIHMKAHAAEENGYDTIVIPKIYTPVNIDGINVVQAQTVEEALEYGLDPVNNTTTQHQQG